MVTHAHIWKLWLRGWRISQLAREYGVQADWVEEGIRKYWRRSL